MGIAVFTNNATSTLASAITNVATTLTVQASEAALFPTPAAGDWFPVTLVEGSKMEIVRCTARSGATLTVTRGQEGTTVQAFGAGATVDHRLTMVALQAFVQDAGDTMTGPLVLPAGSAAATSLNFGAAGTGFYGTPMLVKAAVNGADVMVLAPALGTFAVPLSLPTSGSAAATSMYFGTAGTGLYGGSSSISVAVGGVQKLLVGGSAVVTTVPVSLPADPSNPLEAATKQYVDAQGTLKEDKANKGAVNGYASLDGSAKVPAAQLPAYVDDVLEFANLAAFPATGTTGIIYVALDTNKVYRWGGSSYTEISPSPGSTDAVPEGSTNLYYTNVRASAAAPVQSVAGRTGAVTLTKTDVGLANVDNTSDVNKPVSTAQQTAIDAKVAKAGDTMTGVLTMPLGAAGAPSFRFGASVNGLWSDAAGVYITIGGATRWSVTSSGLTAGLAITLPGDPSTALQAATKQYVDAKPSGNVSGPASAHDNGLARFDGTTGALIQDSNSTLDDSGNLFLGGQLSVAANPTTALQVATKQYVDATSGGTPAGAIVAFAMSTAPTGWLKANGATISRTTYAALFAAIGVVFGPGDGSTTFQLPDLRGEFPRYWDDSRGIDVGRAFGSAQTADLAPHLHPVSITSGLQSADHAHNVSINTGTESASHTHTFSDASSSTGNASANHTHNATGSPNCTPASNAAGSAATQAASASGASGAAHTHTVAVSGTTGGISANHYHLVSGGTSGMTASHAHLVSGNTDNSTGTETRPRNIALLACIKY
jgi:microcystin-dependent protein